MKRPLTEEEREARRASGRAYYLKNRKRILAKMHSPDYQARKKVYNQARYRRQREKFIAMAHKYREEHREQYAITDRKKQARNRDRHAERKHARKMVERALAAGKLVRPDRCDIDAGLVERGDRGFELGDFG